MTRIATLALALLLSLTAVTAQAGDAIEALAGDWLVESFDGEQTEPGMEMKISFVDDETMKMTITVNGQEVVSEEVRYEATEEGDITVYTEDEPDGESAKWEVADDGKLHITTEEEGEMILGRA